jgi:dipeptidase E
MYVAGLREGCLFKVKGNRLMLEGERPLRVFKFGDEPREYQKHDDISFLMGG